MNENLRFTLTIIVGVLIIICLNLLVYRFFRTEKYQLADFLGKWELVSTIECKTCANLTEEIVIKNNEMFYIENNQFRMSKRFLIEDYTIPTDVYLCFALDKNKLVEEPCKDTEETSTYNLIYERSS